MPKHKPTPKKSKMPFLLLGLAAVLLIALAVVVVLNQPSNALPAVVNVTDANNMRDSGAFMLDVREPSEWEQAHIPGATLIPLGQLESRLSELPKDQEILVYCRSGNRSQTGRDILKNAGFTQVTSMSGGINDWINQGFPTVSGP